MHYRNHVDAKIVDRLTKRLPTDLPDALVAEDMRKIAVPLEVVMEKVLWNTHIDGYSEEDLVSFMLMKTHQLLARGKYDWDKSPYSFLYAAHTNLMRDIVRMRSRSLRRGFEIDTLDIAIDRHLNCDILFSGVL